MCENCGKKLEHFDHNLCIECVAAELGDCEAFEN